MGDPNEDQRRLKEKFCFSTLNRVAPNPGRHVFDENLKVTPAPMSEVIPSELIMAITFFSVNFTQAGGKSKSFLKNTFCENKICHHSRIFWRSKCNASVTQVSVLSTLEVTRYLFYAYS